MRGRRAGLLGKFGGGGMVSVALPKWPNGSDFSFYAALVTVIHLRFVMSTRLRMPFIDPMAAILVGIGLAGIASGISARNGTVLTSTASA
jgi:tetrahydromethanopterin S-methyltransferase subunit E